MTFSRRTENAGLPSKEIDAVTPEKILSVVEKYRARLIAEGVPKRRMDASAMLASLSREDCLAHAHQLADRILQQAHDPRQTARTNRHLGSLQMILSFAGWYTLEELMADNHLDPEDSPP